VNDTYTSLKFGYATFSYGHLTFSNMTQIFLVFVPEKDEYAIRSIGLGHLYTRIIRPEGMDDEKFKELAISKFDDYIKKEQILNGEVIKTGYIY